ncbi:MAG: hypothetical protein ACPHF2_02190 [Crocinitomicaceae bacterium]|jgi:hypothetical protein
MKKQFLFSRNVSCGSKIRGGGLTSDDSWTPDDYLKNLRPKKKQKKTKYAVSPTLCKDVYNKLGFELKQTPLGQGASGFVFAIKNRPDLVVKEQSVGTPEWKRDFMNEVKALKELQGQTVSYNGQEWRIVPRIEASGTCMEESTLADSGYSENGYIVLERLQRVREMTPEWKAKARAVLDRARELGCLQVDVKQDNFMNNKNGDPVMIDWGWGWCSGWGEPNSQTYMHDYKNLRDRGFEGLKEWQAQNVQDLLG